MDRIINYRLYAFELLFVCLVVLVHAFRYNEQYILDSLGRATVLFFFIFSGYYYNRTINKKNYKYKKTLKRCLRLLIIAFAVIVIYIGEVFMLRWSELCGIPLFSVGFSVRNFVDFIYANEFAFVWFIFSLVWCYLLFPIINKIRWIQEKKHSLVLSVIILIVVYAFRVFAGKYKLSTDYFSFSNIVLTRNALFTGMPRFFIGTYIYDNLEKIKTISIAKYTFLFFLLIASTISEACIHMCIGSDVNEFYISSILLSTVTVIHCLQVPQSRIGEVIYKVLGFTGPTFVYLSHVFFLVVYKKIMSFPNSDFLIIPLAIISSMVIACVFYQVRIISVRTPTERLYANSHLQG